MGSGTVACLPGSGYEYDTWLSLPWKLVNCTGDVSIKESSDKAETKPCLYDVGDRGPMKNALWDISLPHFFLS